MKTYTQWFSLPILVCMFSCATTHDGKIGVQNSHYSPLPLVISAKNANSEVGSEAFQLIDVTLENTSSKWVRINRVDMVISDPMKSKLSVVVGEDLRDWAQAVELKSRQSQYNKELAQTGLVATAAALMVAGGNSNNTGMMASGLTVGTGTYLWAVSDSFRTHYNWVHSIEKVPDSHLYRPMSVPPGLFLRRWLLINKPVNSTLKSLVLDVETIEGEKAIYEIKLL